MEKIAVYGAGGFGREVKAWIEQTGGFEFVGFFDDNRSVNSLVNGAPVLGGISDLNSYPGELSVVFAIGAPIIKKEIIEKVENPNIKYPALIHPSVVIGDREYVEIGEGCIIAPNSVISTNVVLGRHVAVNYLCSIGHDTVVKDYSAFMPAVNIAGEVEIGECVYAGTGAKVINRTHIGDHTIVGAGAVVISSLPEHCTAVGIPAKPIKFHTLQSAGEQ